MVKITTINILEQPRSILLAIFTRPWLAALATAGACVVVFGVWLFQFLGAPEDKPSTPAGKTVEATFPEKIDLSALEQPRFKALQSFGERSRAQKFGPAETRDIFAPLVVPEESFVIP